MGRGWLCPDIDDEVDPCDPYTDGRDPDDSRDAQIGD